MLKLNQITNQLQATPPTELNLKLNELKQHYGDQKDYNQYAASISNSVAKMKLGSHFKDNIDRSNLMMDNNLRLKLKAMKFDNTDKPINTTNLRMPEFSQSQLNKISPLSSIETHGDNLGLKTSYMTFRSNVNVVSTSMDPNVKLKLNVLDS